MQVRWISAFIDRDAAAFDVAVDFWAAVADSEPSERRGDDNEFVTLQPITAADAHLRVQDVATGSAGSHIDLHVTDVSVGAAEAVDLGAVVVAGNDEWTTLQSPAGVLFCIVSLEGEVARQQPHGTPSTLVDQVTIDCDPEPFDAELDFWSRLTGWLPTSTSSGEFAPLERPEHLPLRVMLQRRDTPSGPATCHLDLACDDVAAAAQAHSALDARIESVHKRWTVMTDPGGIEYCLTSRLPSTGHLS